MASARMAGLMMAAAMLAGCATPYQDMGMRGGVAAAPITDDLWRITARGNLHTGAETIQDHVLLKAAETTLAAGRSHFVIVGKSSSSTHVGGLYGGLTLGTGSEQSGYGLFSANRREIGEDLMIRLLPKTASAQEKAEALDARQLVANIGPRVTRPEP